MSSIHTSLSFLDSREWCLAPKQKERAPMRSDHHGGGQTTRPVVVSDRTGPTAVGSHRGAKVS